VWTEIQISDVIDPEKSLRYQYQRPNKTPIWKFTLGLREPQR